MKTKNVVFRVDPGTYRQIEAEAQRRGLSVSSYVRLMATAPFVEAGPPDARPLNQEIKQLIAEVPDVRPGDLRTQLDHFLRSVEAVMAAQSVINDTARWLVNIGNAVDDDPDRDLIMMRTAGHFRRAVETVMTVQGQIDAAARQLVTIGNALDLTTRQQRSTPHVSAERHEGDLDTPAEE
jgi:hypothetical protein